MGCLWLGVLGRSGEAHGGLGRTGGVSLGQKRLVFRLSQGLGREGKGGVGEKQG